VSGLVAGIVGAKLYGDALARRVRGRSDAHASVGRARLAAFLGFSVLVFTVVFSVLIAR
jgi:hypothetical protein